MKVIVGLGNPGQGYAHNRHNLGFMCVNHFAKAHGIRFDKKTGQARIGTGAVDGEAVIVARPQTYMNESGQAVGKLVKKFAKGLDDLVVIHDDLDLPVGRMRIRRGGSAGGHNGIKSIINALGPDFIRIRVGIGRPSVPQGGVPTPEDEIVGYVLSGFTRDEKKVIEETIPKVSEAIGCIITEGLMAAMNKYNQTEKSEI